MPRPCHAQKRQCGNDDGRHAGQQLTDCRTYLRLTDSVTTPEKAPNSNIGMVRAAETIATARPEPVTSR